MDLPPAQRSVLEVLIAAEGRVVSRERLARRAGLRDASPRRVDSLLSALRKELGDDVLTTVRGRGWSLTKHVEL